MNFGIILITVSILWAALEIILARRKHSQLTDKRIDKSSLHVLWVTIAISVNLGIIVSFQRIGYFGNGSRIFPIAGLTFIVCGLLVRWLAIFSLKHQFTVDVSITKDHRIIRNRIYRYVRHPAYAGSLLSFFGLGLFFADYVSMLVIFLPICLAFLYRIRIEEKFLIDNFGEEYLTYCALTKRLIPGII
ncbi:MAG TPA: isoprenylcysteine carboxylmethyltransferase family protein [Candidatus Acidoferrales bacterium]|nr:isoprenylcysteine carboxylmethyltransferase family protein [Candidatus Acidoferrales bacterium]